MAGRVYVDKLYIERRPEAGWPNERPEEWFLPTDSCVEHMSDDLPRLEALLYEWALENEYIKLGKEP